MEWYSRTVSLGIESIDLYLRIWIWMIDKLFALKSLGNQKGAIDLEWHYHFQFNWEWKETMVSITWNRMQLNQWYQSHGIGCNSWSSSIGGAIDLEWYYLFQFNWEWKESMVSITWNSTWWTSSIGGALDLEWHYLINYME